MNPIEKRIAEVMNHLATADSVMSPSVAEQVVAQCRIKGLTADDVIQGRTPKAIADIWMRHRMVQTQPMPSVCDSQSHRLLPFSMLVHHDIMHRDGGRRWTFPILLRTKTGNIDIERLRTAVGQVIAHHPVFSMHIGEDRMQQYTPGYRSPYIEAKAYQQEGYVYLSMKLNRILGDAASFVLMAQNIWRAYRGEPLPHDGYLQYLSEYEAHARSSACKEHAEWLRQQYDRPSYPLMPLQDSPEGLLGHEAYVPLIVQPDYADQLTAFSHKEHISVNAFYCLATALAIMDYNTTDEAGLTWAYLGRETREEMSIFGSLHRDIPMRITKTGTKTKTKTERETMAALLAQLRQQMEQGIVHSDYPFTLLSPEESPWHTAVNVLVQPSLAEAMEGCPAEFELVAQTEQAESYCMLDIDITLTPLTLTINYSPHHYTQASIQRFADLIDKNARMLQEQSLYI